MIENCRNLAKPTTQGAGDRTDVLNGLRVMAMGHVVLAHSFFFFMEGSNSNLEDYPGIIKGKWFFIITFGTYAVDTFFLLSGFLASYILLARRKKEPCWAMVLHRVLRLFPLYLFVMLLVTALFPVFASGPLYFLYADSSLTGC